MSDFRQMDREAFRHIRHRVLAAHRRTLEVLRDQTRHGFDPLEHLLEPLQHTEDDLAVDVMQLAVDFAPQYPSCHTVEDTVVSRAAVGHLFGQQLLTEPARRDRFNDTFVETAHDLELAAGYVGVEQALANGYNPEIAYVVNGYEPYLPPTDLPHLTAVQLTAYFANGAFTTLLEEYIPPSGV